MSEREHYESTIKETRLENYLNELKIDQLIEYLNSNIQELAKENLNPQRADHVIWELISNIKSLLNLEVDITPELIQILEQFSSLSNKFPESTANIERLKNVLQEYTIQDIRNLKRIMNSADIDQELLESYFIPILNNIDITKEGTDELIEEIIRSTLRLTNPDSKLRDLKPVIVLMNNKKLITNQEVADIYTAKFLEILATQEFQSATRYSWEKDSVILKESIDLGEDLLKDIWSDPELETTITSEVDQILAGGKIENGASEMAKIIAESIQEINLPEIFAQIQSSNFGENDNPGEQALDTLSKRVIDLINKFKNKLSSDFNSKDVDGVFSKKKRLFVVYLDMMLRYIIDPINQGIADSIYEMTLKKGIEATEENPFITKWLTPFGIPGAGKGTLVEYNTQIAQIAMLLDREKYLGSIHRDDLFRSQMQMAEGQETMPSGTKGPFIKGSPETDEETVRFSSTRKIGLEAKDIFGDRIYLGGWSAFYNLEFARFIMDGAGAKVFIGDVYPFDDFQKKVVNDLINKIGKKFQDNEKVAQVKRESFIVMRSTQEDINYLRTHKESSLKAIKLVNSLISPLMSKLAVWPIVKSPEDETIEDKKQNLVYYSEILYPTILRILNAESDPAAILLSAGATLKNESLLGLVSNVINTIKTLDIETIQCIRNLITETYNDGLGGIKSRLEKGENRVDNNIITFVNKGQVSGLSSFEGAFRDDAPIVRNDGQNIDQTLSTYLQLQFPGAEDTQSFGLMRESMILNKKISDIAKLKGKKLKPNETLEIISKLIARNNEAAVEIALAIDELEIAA